MKHLKNILLAITSFFAISFFIYSYILNMRNKQVNDGFNDCYELISIYEDSLLNQKLKYDSINDFKKSNE